MQENTWPIFFRDQIKIGDLSSNVAICCLWTKRSILEKRIDPKKYAALGNLYSRDGINYVIRNILANPRIRYLVLWRRDRAGSGDSLSKFFVHGISDDHLIRGTDVQLDKTIDQNAIEVLRKSVELLDMRDTNVDHIEQAVQACKPLSAFGRSRTFPIWEPQVHHFPAENNGFIVRGKTVADAWVQLLSIIMDFGHIEQTAYSLRQKEILGLMSIITHEEPDKPTIPAWMQIDSEKINEYTAHLFDDSIDDDLAYTYGARLLNYEGIDQIAYIVDELEKTSFSRRCVASLWQPKVDTISDSPPCLNLVQAMIRGDSLHLTVYIRSNDMFRAWPYNAYSLRKLQKAIADQVGIHKLGDLVIISESAHIYEDCLEKAQNIVDSNLDSARKKPTFRRDPRGSFAVQLSGKTISVLHYGPNQERLHEFRGNSKSELFRQINPFVSTVDHGLYLGAELQKAETALRNGWTYVQDA